MKTSLCLIGKNEADGLKNLIKDIGQYFDEIILASTWADKKLENQAKKLGVKVYRYKWKDDFADARNFSFSKALGDIQAYFDLDDRIPNGQVIPYIFKAMKKVDWIYCNYNYAFNEYGDITVKHLLPRFMKKGTFIWEKSVHECLKPLKSVKQIKDSDFLVNSLIINHTTNNNIEDTLTRAKRNLAILTKELKKDGKKTDLRTIQYIASSLMTLQEYDKAIPFFKKHFLESGSDDDRYWSLINWAFCLNQQNKDNEAINILLEAIKLFPEWATAYVKIGQIYSLQENWKKTIEWMTTALTKKYPDTLQMTDPHDYTLQPLSRLAEAYLYTSKYDEALAISKKLKKMFPKDSLTIELNKTAQQAVRVENFVKSFINVASVLKEESRLKAIELFNVLPDSLDGDIRIQSARFAIVPPKTWGKKEIVIYCGKGIGEHWAYPSIFTGIGGSEEAVINISQQLSKMGYKITIYNNCGELRGEYDNVIYLPFYHFNPIDNFNILIAWRNPLFFENKIRAKKKFVWLHDIAYPEQFSDKAIKNTDKFLFLSQWHRNNMPKISDSKIFITNNGLDPEQFADIKPKRPNSLLWTSSYDRGLLSFVKNIFPQIQKVIPSVTLDVAYGWQNIDREKDKIPELRKLREELTPILENTKGVKHHGRLSHLEIAELYKTSQILAYASEFGETNNISSQKAQVAGCYVISTPQAGATPERLRFGALIGGKGIYTDVAQQKRYTKAVIRYLKNPQKSIKGLAEQFSWQKTAESWRDKLL
jgi:tetratricopeptide (TPR) repeat protein/glycosyltransferase involved in cell wall biosynthesis